MSRKLKRQELEAKRLLTKGAVLKLYSNDLKVRNKTKRFLVFAVSSQQQFVAKLYFDSNCPPIPYQVPFEPDSSQYLNRKSYLDCSEVYEDNYSRILDKLIKSPNAHIGQMSDSDLVRVEQQILIAITIPSSIKQKCGII